MTQSDAIDPAVIDELRSLSAPGEPPLLDELIDIHLDEAPRELAAIHSAIASGDADGLATVAQRFKSGSGSIGAMRVMELTEQLQSLGRSGTTDGAAELAAVRRSAVAHARPRRTLARGTDERDATVHRQHDAGDVARFVRGEEERGVGDVPAGPFDPQR